MEKGYLDVLSKNVLNNIKNMDMIISTDNVSLNLAGALGVKTTGLFGGF